MGAHPFFHSAYGRRIRCWDDGDTTEVIVSLNPGWRFSGPCPDPHQKAFATDDDAIGGVYGTTPCTCLLCAAATWRRQYEITTETRFGHKILGLRVGERHFGFVTVDFEERSYRMGYKIRTAPPQTRYVFSGDGWENRLVDAAREALIKSAIGYDQAV